MKNLKVDKSNEKIAWMKRSVTDNEKIHFKKKPSNLNIDIAS